MDRVIMDITIQRAGKHLSGEGNTMIKNFPETPDFGKYYKHIIDHVPGAMIVFGIDDGMLHVRYVSDNCIKISGFTPEETYERSMVSPIADAHPADRARFINHAWSPEDSNLSFTYRIVCKDGNYKWVHLELSRVQENDEVLYYGVFSDVDEAYKREEEQRRQNLLAERQQRDLQDMYQNILDETKAMITIIDAETFQVVYANKMAVQMADTKEEYIGCTCYRGIHHADTPCKGCMLLREETLPAETKELTYAGRTYRMIKKMFLWNQRKALLEYSEDITEQRQFQKIEIDLEAEKRANQAKTQFLSRVSHDMRTPLNGILGLTSLMKERVTDEDIKHDLLELEMSGEYLLDLINDTLDVSRIESGKLELHPSVADGRAVFQNAINLARTSIKEKKLTLNIKAEDIPFTLLYVDVSRIEQVVMNVLGNAVKFTPEGGTIDVTLENLAVQDGVITDRLIIKDSGIGMSPEFLPHIFEAFSQADASKTSTTKGTGLGMAITKQIIQRMGGDISVESEQGKGTTFTIILKMPMASEEQTAEWNSRTDGGSEYTKLAGKRVLLCEDHPLNTQIATRILETKEIVVEHAENGQVGVDCFIQSPANYYDAVLMDIRMPVMDGIEAAKAIRSLHREDAASIPIIAMTANAFADDIEQTKDAGMNAHLSKPVQREKLYQTLAELIK